LRNGKFSPDPADNTTSLQDLEGLFTHLTQQPRQTLVLHFHGGLTDFHSGLEVMNRLRPQYEATGAYPIFFLWQTGIFDALEQALPGVFGEGIFKRLLEQVLRGAVGKLGGDEAGRGFSAADLPELVEVKAELKRSEAYSEVRATPETTPLTPQEQAEFQRLLEQDLLLQNEVGKVINGLEGLPPDRGRDAGVQESASSLLDESVKQELREAATPPDRGLLDFVKPIALRGALVLFRVIKRMLERRDHGLHATVVEEILRELYGGMVGGAIWSSMKNSSLNSFGDDPQCGGTAFLRGLRAYLEPHPDTRVVLVGHSAGSIFICNLLKEAARHLLGFKFEAVFLAAACDFGLLAQVLEKGNLRSLHNFGLSDALERADAVLRLSPVPDFLKHLYPHSLLYLVSGLFEEQVDQPLVGMQRFYSGYDSPVVRDVLERLRQIPNRMIWSEGPAVPESGAGLLSTADNHPGFDNDATTLKSLQSILTA
jgi:pimeloyl-ACP methyl ester carboxylesterase